MLLLYFAVVGLLCSNLKHATAFKQQSFRVTPKDVNARQGTNVTLRCEINDISGDVQWTKDGLALGYAAEIPGHPRHSMVIDAGNGVYNLLVREITVKDDALYQCQVSPGPIPGSKPIRSSARLTVLTPPSSVKITDLNLDTILEVQENQEAVIDCTARNSKPPSTIVWSRGHVEINPENREENITEEISEISNTKLYTVHSRIKVRTTSQDDRVKYTCEARHEALATPLKSSIQIRVLYPPGIPHIEGYTEGDIVDKGQHVNLRCVSKVGNPPAQLTWFKNGHLIHSEYRTTEKVSESTYSFIADVSDNNAKYRCEAKNSISPDPLYADVMFSVSFAPSQVKIKGPVEAKQGDAVSLSCETGRSNPPSVIKWLVAGEPEKNSTSTVVAGSQSSWITKSNVTFVMPLGQRSVVAICQAVNNHPSDKVTASHKVNVLYPPGAPIIIDYLSGERIPTGEVLKLSCLSTGGNPLASLAWYKNDKKVHSTITTNENSVSADLSFMVNYTDNGAILKCEATHPALQVPMIKTMKMDVEFMIQHLEIKQDPVHLRPGTLATFTCEGGSSNPLVKLNWCKNNTPVPNGINSFSKPGLYGGRISIVQLTLNITSAMDGVNYTCQGSHPVLNKNIYREHTVNVLRKPIFDPYPEQITLTEGDDLSVTLLVKGRPEYLTYKWSKNDEPLRVLPGVIRQSIHNCSMNITDLVRGDAGKYTCEAINTEGSSSVSFVVSVKYKAIVTDTSAAVVVKGGEEAVLWCKIDGYPLSPVHISWTRPNFTFDKRTFVELKDGTSYLTIHNVTKEDAGSFECAVNNGVGNISSLSAVLIVEHKPEIVLKENELKTASNAGVAAKLHCRAAGAPFVHFTWEHDGSNINSMNDKYAVEEKQLDSTRYESTLTILQVEQFDYGDYSCTATNHMGRATAVNRLTVFSHPDPPTNLRSVNLTHNAMLMAWSPGFDGGEPATYRIRYRAFNKQTYHYEDLGSESRHLITGLEPATTYLFGVMAHNIYGDSSYALESLKVTTLSLTPKQDISLSITSEPLSSLLILLSIICVGLVIVVNIFCSALCLYNREKTGKDDKKGIDKSQTGVEMNVNNTSYEEHTSSSTSDKTETYSNVSPEYNDDQRQKAAVEQSYMIEQIDYPFITESSHSASDQIQPYNQYYNTTDDNVYDPNIMAEYNVHDNINLESRVYRHHQQMPPPPPMPIMPETSRIVPPLPILINRPPPAIPIPLTAANKYYNQQDPPPDVTVFSAQNYFTTFGHKPSETEGHLV
ncbi:nephrin [Adelges cooleyi]|uniref:nephrin n=1 Tax=Adelges cooleyi TaxID=133065 RepID=UPI00217F96F2|nr:nephrin [Adelges cooleyi]